LLRREEPARLLRVPDDRLARMRRELRARHRREALRDFAPRRLAAELAADAQLRVLVHLARREAELVREHAARAARGDVVAEVQVLSVRRGEDDGLAGDDDVARE